MTPERKPPIRLAWLKKMRLPPYLVTASLLSVVAVLIALGAQEIAQRWKINQIDIVGRLNVVKAEQLVGQLVWVKNESFFELDVRQVREQISGLPMLESVAIRKR
ncbi:MAG: FtsQ-type POTRA domain-containing protein, partial [Oceanobacter sp.]